MMPEISEDLYWIKIGLPSIQKIISSIPHGNQDWLPPQMNPSDLINHSEGYRYCPEKLRSYHELKNYRFTSRCVHNPWNAVAGTKEQTGTMCSPDIHRKRAQIMINFPI
jgi:hypothetical protein